MWLVGILIALPFVVMYWIVKAYIKWPAARVVLLIIMCISTVTAVVGAATRDAKMWPPAATYAVISALMSWHVWRTFSRRRQSAEGVATVEAPQVPRRSDTTPQVPLVVSPTRASTVLETTWRTSEAGAEHRRAAAAFRMLLAKRALAGIAGPVSDSGAWQRISV